MAQRLIYHWKHGWIPLDHYAALSKAHGSKTGADKLLSHGAPQHGAPAAGDGKSHHLEQSLQAKHATSSPVGKDSRTMTSAQKIKAAEIMYGTGSAQHRAAQKRFGGTKPASQSRAEKLAASREAYINAGPQRAWMRNVPGSTGGK